MHPRDHLIVSALCGVTLYRRRPRRAVLLTLAGVLLDLDHYLLYALRSGDWNPLGAIRYDRRRHRRPRPGDSRPRYGSLRSVAHQPVLALPLLWALCRLWPVLRPVAIGVGLHLLLDVPPLNLDWRVWRRAQGRCECCGGVGLVRDVRYVVPPAWGGDPWTLNNRAAWCRRCAARAYDKLPKPPLDQKHMF